MRAHTIVARALAFVALCGALSGCSAPLRDADDAGPCPMTTASSVRCAGACVDTASDPRNCGGCARACRAGFACVSGTCSTSCAAGFISCGGECVDPRTDARFCGASLDCAGANAGRTCSRVEQCVSGLCTYFESPRSEVTPFPDANEFAAINVPRPVELTINSVLSGRVHYTLDGTAPRPGTASTQTATMPATVTVGGSEGLTVTLRWYAEYGGFYDREPTIRQRLIRVTPDAAIPPEALHEHLTFNGTPGTILVEPGAPIMVRMTAQRWRQMPTWWCPGCVITQWYAADTTETTSRNFLPLCREVAAPPFPGDADQEVAFSFAAPMARGRYAVRFGSTPDFARSCPRLNGGAPIAFFYVR
jgi:hypothetical protein